MVEILFTISIISFILSGTAFIVAVFCWFRFKIPQVVGDLSGRTAKKSIERMRAGYEKSGDMPFHVAKIYEKRGKLTGSISPAGRFKVSKKKGGNKITAKDTFRSTAGGGDKNTMKSGSQSEDKSTMSDIDKSTVKGRVKETESLPETMSRNTGVEETCLLTEDPCTEKMTEETVFLLNHEVISTNQVEKQLTMLEEIIMIHTDEVIL